MTHHDTAAEQRDGAFGTVAVFASIVAIGLAGVYWIARTGFANPIGPAAKAAALSLFMINAPYLIRIGARRISPRYHWATSYSFLWLLTVATATLLGRLVPATGLNPFPVIAVLGVLCFAVTTVDWVRRGRLWRSLAVIAGSAVFAGWAAGVVWGRIYKSPLFMEMLAANGIVHHDGIGLAALGNMLRTYHTASMGLDGLVYMPYHWGTPWMFAQLSELLGTDVLGFYQLGYAVTMIPFFFGGILAFATEIRAARESRLASSIAPGPGNRRRASPADLRNSLPLLGIFLVATIGVFPITGMDAMGVWTSNLTISESYAAALPAALLLLATAIVFWEAGGREALGIKAIGAGNIVFVFVVIPLGILLLGYLKISFMLLGFLVAVYVAAREGLLRRPVFIALATALTAAVALTYRVVSLPQHREGIVPLDFLKGFVPLEWWPFFFAVHLFWSWLYVVLRLRAEGVRTVGDLWDAAKAGRILDAEIVTIVALAGVAPGLVLHIDGGSAFYFSDVQRWLSVGFLIGGLGILVPAFHRSAGLPRVLLAFLAIPLIVTMCFNTLYWPVRMLRANVETRRALYPADVAASIPLGLRGLPHLLEGRYLQGALSAARNTRPIEGLRRLASLPLKERRQTALFIPQTESRYWQILARPGACTFAGHVAPALTGMAMVDGMPPVGCRLSPYYGLGGYAPRTRPQSEADATPDALCRRATASGLSRVMTLSFAADGELQSRVISCRQVR